MKNNPFFAFVTALFLFAFIAAGCGGGDGDEETVAEDTTTMTEDVAPAAPTATVALQPTQGNTAQGTLTLVEENGGVHITGTVSGLTEGAHGIHVHENGDCSAPDASSAGAHFNPTNAPHGGPAADSTQRHMGDFGNLTADASGTAMIDVTIQHVSFTGPNGISGKAVIVHGGEDDLTTQPSGNSGPRLACGVIQMEGGSVAIPSDTSSTL